jgi:hypothetical protein
VPLFYPVAHTRETKTAKDKKMVKGAAKIAKKLHRKKLLLF